MWDCVKWGEVRKLWLEEIRPLSLEDYTSNMADYTRLRSVPRLLIGRALRSSNHESLLTGTSALVESIGAVFESSILVDSSKHAARAMMYSMIPGIDLRVIQIIRDPRGYVQSRRSQLERLSRSAKSGGESWNFIVKCAIRWGFTNFADEAVGRPPATPRLRLRYEDLLSNPSKSLIQLERLLEVDFTEVQNKLERQQEIGFSHIVAGNRVRLSGQTHLNEDDAWRTRISGNQQRLIWAFGLPLSALYGYSP